MSGLVLVINSGSSSIKYQLLDPSAHAVVASGLVEQIGEPEGRLRHEMWGRPVERRGPIPDHGEGLRLALVMFAEGGLDLDKVNIAAVGHRVVHGGQVFHEPTLITPSVVAEIARLAKLAPLHNPANVIGIEVAQQQFPDIPHVAVFDTGFFHTLPGAAATYAIDSELAQRYEVRRYGFHGTSHQYVAQQVAAFLGRELRELNSSTICSTATRGSRA